MQEKKTIVVLLFDSTQNSVFESQVLLPLQKKLKAAQSTQALIVSFERTPPPQKLLDHIKQTHNKIRICILRRPPLVAKILLQYAMHQFKKIMRQISGNVSLRARGPIAGYIARKANLPLSIDLTIQVRGLAAEEYRYTQEKRDCFNTLLSRYRYRMLKKIEQKAYGPDQSQRICFEAVSTALIDYICHTWQTPRSRCQLAQDDHPIPITELDYQRFRTNSRNQLGLSRSQTLYCYSGSAKPWQCPLGVLDDFRMRKACNTQAQLLILTTDVKLFSDLLTHYPQIIKSITLRKVPAEKLFEHLCGADYGYLLRDYDIINWVSRPTKLLEYRAARLSIIHNNSIALLNQERSNSCIQKVGERTAKQRKHA